MIHRRDLCRGEVFDGVTSPEVTLEQCLRGLPFLDALAIADSALREGYGRSRLDALAESVRGPGSPQVRRVCRAADGLAANPFESTTRGISLDLDGLALQPQVPLPDTEWPVQPDLVDVRLRIVVEADSFEWHGGRTALAEDARRYNMMVVSGWMVLRFSYEEVMLNPEGVRRVLEQAVTLAEMLHQVGIPRGSAA